MSSCMSTRSGEPFIPKEYQFPEDSLLIGRTFVYEKEGTNDKSFTDLKLNVVGNKRHLVSRQYSSDKLFDSVVTVEDKTKAIYSFSFDDEKPLKGLIAQDTILKNDTKLGLRTKRTIFKASDYVSDNISTLEYLKDTVLLWQNKKVDCIVLTATSTTQLISNSNISASQKLTSYHNLYYGKNLGLLKYTTSFKDEHYAFVLVEILDTK